MAVDRGPADEFFPVVSGVLSHLKFATIRL
jgi:hypothetical protein